MQLYLHYKGLKEVRMCVTIMMICALFYMVHRDSKLICKMEEESRIHDEELK